ncbi:MAG: DUF1566 domain-containing protein [Spirochaetales bacterium]|jgi:hypothetical protein|nr:DUF1566 domain-containing protein [Spirochaetales bacterium]
MAGRRIICLALIPLILAACTENLLQLVQEKVSHDRQKTITEYSFTASANQGLDDDVTGVIEEDQIFLIVPVGTALTHLVADFQIAGSAVLVGTVHQESGTTENDFTEEVTYTVEALDGTTAAFVVTVREARDNAELESLSLLKSGGGVTYEPYLEPVFNSAVYDYMFWVPNQVSGIDLQAASVDTDAGITINGSAAGSTTLLILDDGPNNLELVVTAEDGLTQRTYTIKVYRAQAIPRTGSETALTDGEDGQTQYGVAWPDLRFSDNSDGTVTDSLTGLVWLQSGSAFPNYEWEEALDAVQDLEDGSAGLSDGSAKGDWRMPNFLELYSLVNNVDNSPGTWLNTQGFANIGTGYPYWNSTTRPGVTNNKYFISFADGSGASSSQVATSAPGRAILPVRGPVQSGVLYPSKTGQTITYRTANDADDDGAFEHGIEWPDPRFIDLGDGTILDRLSGLIWVEDWTLIYDGSQTWSQALTRVADLKDDGINLTDNSNRGDWRLPNIRELATLLNYDEVGIAAWLESFGFDNVPPATEVWSSTSVGATASAYGLHMSSLDIRVLGKGSGHPVIAVRTLR